MKGKLQQFVRRFGAATSLMLGLAPIFFIMFLGGMMARGQVQGAFKSYQAIQEYNSLAALNAVPENEVVMLRGKIVDGPSPDYADGLVIFQERPLEGRELRFQEEFPLVFPDFTLALSDGTQISVQPREERVISHENHRVIDKARDREYTGFRKGDEITVQGRWQSTSTPALQDVSGISSLNRAAIIADGQSAFSRLDTICLVLGILTGIPLVLLAIQAIRTRLQPKGLDPINA